MISWSDQAIVLHNRAHGESSRLLTVLSQNHGRWSGLCRHRRQAPLPQVGDLISVTWSARLKDSLGYWTVEDTHSYVGIQGQGKTLALCSGLVLAYQGLADRSPAPQIYDLIHEWRAGLLKKESDLVKSWGQSYADYERRLLASLGFGLDYSRCAVTGTPHVTHLSPKTGRGVCEEVAAPYHPHLFPIPTFWKEDRVADVSQIAQSLKITGYFWEKNIAFGPLPPLRYQLYGLFL